MRYYYALHLGFLTDGHRYCHTGCGGDIDVGVKDVDVGDDVPTKLSMVPASSAPQCRDAATATIHLQTRPPPSLYSHISQWRLIA
jgi:hypothetical protein